MLRKTLTAALAAAICLSGPGCQTPTLPSIPLETLLAAPEAVDIAGRTYVLETYLWRDFMPPTNAEGSDLMVVIRVTATDLDPFPDDIGANRLWVINGPDIWETRFSGENRPRDPAHPHQLEKYAGGGPRWDTGIEVQVVVRLVTISGRVFLLRAPDQVIQRTV